MFVALKGSSAVSVTAGILLLTRARSFGLPLEVEIVGDPTDVAVVHGPALVYSAVLASCGVGREHAAGALVIVPGPPGEPIAVSLSEDGTGPWFLIDRTGVVRWANIECGKEGLPGMGKFPTHDELLAAARLVT